MQLFATISKILIVLATMTVFVGMFILRKSNSLIGTTIVFISLATIFVCYLLSVILSIILINIVPLETIAIATVFGVFTVLEFYFLSNEIKRKDTEE